MGKGYIIKCPNCGYEDSFSIGKGMAFPIQVRKIELKIRNGEYGTAALKQFDVLAESSEEERLDYWYFHLDNVLFSCRKCKSLKVKPFFVLGDYSTSYKCEVCKENMHRVSPGIVKKHRCPNCGEIGKFDRKNKFLWD